MNTGGIKLRKGVVYTVLDNARGDTVCKHIHELLFTLVCRVTGSYYKAQAHLGVIIELYLYTVCGVNRHTAYVRSNLYALVVCKTRDNIIAVVINTVHLKVKLDSLTYRAGNICKERLIVTVHGRANADFKAMACPAVISKAHIIECQPVSVAVLISKAVLSGYRLVITPVCRGKIEL